MIQIAHLYLLGTFYNPRMKVEELIGCRVWVKNAGLPEQIGQISRVLKSVHLEGIASSVTDSSFRIDLASGNVIETTGVNIRKIDHEGYIPENARRSIPHG